MRFEIHFTYKEKQPYRMPDGRVRQVIGPDPIPFESETVVTAVRDFMARIEAYFTVHDITEYREAELVHEMWSHGDMSRIRSVFSLNLETVVALREEAARTLPGNRKGGA